jgi:putative DNA primase/helicase
MDAEKTVNDALGDGPLSEVDDWLAAFAKKCKEGLAAKMQEGEKPPPDEKALIDALAKKGHTEYDRVRIELADKLGIRRGTLDEKVEARRAELEAGTEFLFPHWDTAPSDEDVEAGDLLGEIIEHIHRHVVLARDQAVAVALWIVLSWVHEAAAVHSPILLVTSAEANSGKSTLLGIVGYLARRALLSVSISGPALFRSIEKWQPAFVIDEADTVFKNNDDLREVINSGWTRGQNVIRCDPKTNEPRTYSTFAPKALGMKGKKLPDTTISRSIIVDMRRKKSSEEVQDFDHIDSAGLAQLRRRLARWANDNANRLTKATPEIPDGFHNRVRANWKLLLAIAETAGSEWAKDARGAAEKLAGAADAASIGVELLTDIQVIFAEKGTDRLTSAAIVEALAGIEGRRWAEWGRSEKPITTNALARLLAKFRTDSGIPIAPDSIWVGDRTLKGYLLSQFEDAFTRYLADDTPSFSPAPLHIRKAGRSPQPQALLAFSNRKAGFRTFRL